MIVRFPPEYLMRQPFEVGWSPEPSSSTPALASSSWYWPISAISESSGITPASESLVAFTMIMNRIAVSPLVFGVVEAPRAPPGPGGHFIQ